MRVLFKTIVIPLRQVHARRIYVSKLHASNASFVSCSLVLV